jgi:hypothetical protein
LLIFFFYPLLAIYFYIQNNLYSQEDFLERKMHKIIERMILLSILLLLILPTPGSAMPDEGCFGLEGKPQPLQKEKPIDKIKFPLSSRPIIVQQDSTFLIKVDLSSFDGSVNYHSLNPNGFQEDGFLLRRSNLLELFPIPVEARAPQA